MDANGTNGCMWAVVIAVHGYRLLTQTCTQVSPHCMICGRPECEAQMFVLFSLLRLELFSTSCKGAMTLSDVMCQDMSCTVRICVCVPPDFEHKMHQLPPIQGWLMGTENTLHHRGWAIVKRVHS